MEKDKIEQFKLQIPSEQIWQLCVNNGTINFLQENLSQIDTSVFPNFKYHNITHAINVAILSLVLANFYGLKGPEKKVLVDASLLHDIGRIDDVYDYRHNYIGSVLAEDVLDKEEFYKDEKVLNFVKMLIFAHNKPINDPTIFKRYNIDFKEDNLLLLKILKDADILELTRITELRVDLTKLNLEISKYLFNFSKYLNNNFLAQKVLEGSLNNERGNS